MLAGYKTRKGKSGEGNIWEHCKKKKSLTQDQQHPAPVLGSRTHLEEYVNENAELLFLSTNSLTFELKFFVLWFAENLARR